jgi:hypothetical protein
MAQDQRFWGMPFSTAPLANWSSYVRQVARSPILGVAERPAASGFSLRSLKGRSQFRPGAQILFIHFPLTTPEQWHTLGQVEAAGKMSFLLKEVC